MTELDAFETRFAVAYRRYLADAPTAVDAALVARAAALGVLERRHWTSLARPARRTERRLLWLLAVVALLLVVSAWLLTAGSALLQRTERPTPIPTAPPPSALEVVPPDTAAWPYDQIVADAEGNVWAVGGGRLLRLEPPTATTWAVAEGQPFASGGVFGLIPARTGGVWLVGGRGVRRFDGTGLGQVIDLGTGIATAIEAPDGSLWAATLLGGLVHAVGNTVTRVDDVPVAVAGAAISSIAIDSEGHLWCAWSSGVDVGAAGDWAGVSRFDGLRWVSYTSQDATALGSRVSTVSALADGSVVVAGDAGLARFANGAWTNLGSVARFTAAKSVAMAADGTLWAAGVDPLDFTVWARRIAEGTSTVYGPADGLPGTESVARVASIVATDNGVLIGTSMGIYQLRGDRWSRLWPAVSSPSPGAPEGGADAMAVRTATGDVDNQTGGKQ